MSEVATFPSAYHVNSLRRFLETERKARVFAFKGDAGRRKVAEVDQAIASLNALAERLKPDGGAL